ncbi:MAG: flagellar hook assembly protein FlgD [Gammaproteobacteria bacterium]|nr:flagellar hook assembly protein FlgD [Gammaproteobacteria bacterium]
MDGIDKTTDKNAASFEGLGLAKRDPLKQPQLKQEDFMALMMAQMKHQDPLKPLDNTQFVSQMAQFSSLEGIKDMKNSFATLATTLQSAQALQASSMVGRSVLIPGTVSELPAGGELHAGVDVPSATDQVTVKILDSNGQLLKTIELGKHEEGLAVFSWDGVISKADGKTPGSVDQKARPGKYTLQAEMLVDGKAQAANTLVTDKVNSVSLGKGSQGVTLNLSNSGSKSLADVREIL